MQSPRNKVIVIVVLAVGAAVVLYLLAAGAVGYWVLKGRGLSPASSLGPAFEYDITQYAKARSVGTYRLVSKQGVPGNNYCIALGRGGEVLVGGDGQIDVYDASGTPRSTLKMDAALGDQKIAQVHSLAVAADGTIYAGLAGGIAVCRPGGSFTPLLKRPGSVITSIAIGDDAIFAADFSTASVLCLSRDGKLLRTIDGKARPGESGFVLPSPYFDVAIAPDGLLRIANTGLRRVEAWTPQGSREFVWGKGGPGLGQFSGCCNPAAIAVLPDGRIATAEKGSLLTVTIYKPDGPQEAGGSGPQASGTATTGPAANDAISVVVAGPDQFRLDEEGGVDLAVAPSGRVYVLQTTTGVLSIFDPPAEAKP